MYTSRAKTLSHRILYFRAIFEQLRSNRWEKMAINHRGTIKESITIVGHACVCVCIYIYERRNINNLVVRDSSVGPLIPHSWYGYPRVDPTPLAHQRRHKARSDGANYLFHELPPPTLLPPSPPPARATASLLMLACVYTSRRSPAGAT